MARLNEAPPGAESVEALKRRFIRQNRELAKNNSTQSIRIRSLESEQSRLLAENLDLREQILQLRNQVDNNHSPALSTHVSGIKDALEAKIQELGGLVAELSLLQNPTSTQRASEPPRPNQSKAAEYFEWRRAAKEEMDVEESLPTIKEDKQYPRRTLDAEEIRAVLMDTSNESPELGPPPVAHFPDEEPIKFKTQEPQPQAEQDEERDEDMREDAELPILSVNLETRRKRRDSTKLDPRKMPVFQSPAEESDAGLKSESDAARRVRTGAKRKLRDAMEEHAEETANTKPADDFRFSRRAASDAERTSISRQEKGQSKLDMLVAAERKALGDKTNTSPKKISKTSADSKPDSKKPLPSSNPATTTSTTNRTRTGRDRKSRSTTTTTTIPPPDSIDHQETPPIVTSIEPAQPSQDDEFGPPTTISPPSLPPTNDTPPPPPITTTTTSSSTQEQPSRLARRARPQVNYAEPNLVSKMRRPGKDLAPAVDRNQRRSTSVEVVDGVGSAGKSGDGNTADGKSEAKGEAKGMRTVVIKKERLSSGGVMGEESDAEDEAWKKLPVAAASGSDNHGANSGAEGQGVKLEERERERESPLSGQMASNVSSTAARLADALPDPDLDAAAIMKRSRDLAKRSAAGSSRRHSSIVGPAQEGARGAADGTGAVAIAAVDGKAGRGGSGSGSGSGVAREAAGARLSERRSDGGRADRAGRRRSMML
ncbi:hypothetical protein K490DRAFT_67277 [Saccharata proteae CBS 121410]|uniref:Shugoshin C-terminal domain-containing protein n=1 Tax=Saccharata proteae CBS 121410 TaxID=1314787 RepID=A0A9P4HT71_9PEZI|nr:hypothetical protein K490DRAFT_67277 [Saccharata proteae CBS 121410]